MYKSILLGNKFSWKERLKRLGSYYLLRRGTNTQWKNRYKKVSKDAKNLLIFAPKSLESEHKNYWKKYRKNINLNTLRLCYNISGVLNPKYIPEEVFVADIEPSLNNIKSIEFFNLKSFYNKWFPPGLFPKEYLNIINGEWLDSNLKAIEFQAIDSILDTIEFPVVVKPNRDTYGGKNVLFPTSKEELLIVLEDKKDVIVQEYVIQHPFFSNYNSHGINTFRVNLYRSVIDNRLHVLNIALRMGIGGSLDNLTTGGIVTLIRENGFMNGYAVNKYGRKYLKHPDTNIAFDKEIPDFNGLIDISKRIADTILYARIICLDLCYDENQNWRVIEVNMNNTSIRLVQYHGFPFFADFTDEVYTYCLKNHWILKK